MRVLIAAYYYPPGASGGTERPLKMVKHLSRLGHQVTVLTHTDRRPESLTGPVLRVYDPSHNLHRSGVRAAQWLVRRLATEAANRAGSARSIYTAWKDRVADRAERLVASSRPEVLIATYPPVESLEIGLLLADRFGTPLVSDFRDGLLFEPVERDRIRRHRCVEEHYGKVERAIAARSDGIVTAFPSLSAYFRSAHHREDVVTIPNGFDDEDFHGLEPSGLLGADRFNIVHAGRFGGSYSGCDVGPLADAMALVSARAAAIDRAPRLHQLGSLTARERRLFGDLEAAGAVVVHQPQPRPVALAAQTEADALLLVTAKDRPGNAPGKLFEYLGAGRPIVGLTTGTYAEEIIRETGSGWTVDPADRDAIADLLLSLAAGRPPGPGFRPDRERIRTYSRGRQMERLEALLRAVADGGPPPR